MKILIATIILALGPVPVARALDTNEMLSLVAMPLAVAAVSEIADVPADDLIRVVKALNDADVPPPQFIEVIRYVPIALVDSTINPPFVAFVTSEIDRGITGIDLAHVITEQYRTYGFEEIDVIAPRIALVQSHEIIPVYVTQRVAQVKQHPHGGPPGQIKKELGLQTGAEVVHGTARNDGGAKPLPPGLARKGEKNDPPGANRPKDVRKNDDRGKGNSGNQGKGHDKGKGKGKGAS